MDFEARLLASLEADIAANRLILPSLPDVAIEVRRMVEADAPLAQLAAVIGRDPALSARLIKVANSASMRGRSPVEEIRGAIQRLGLRLVRSLVHNLAIIQAFQHGDRRLQEQLRAVLEHSMEIAVLSHALAAEYTRLNADEAMLAGLIHDIGKLPLLRRVCDMPEFRGDAERFKGPCHQLHARIGARVLEAWNFLPELVAVAREHEDLGRTGGSTPDLVDVVIVANLCAHRRAGTEPWGGRRWSDVPAVQKLGLAANDAPISDERYREARELIGG